MYCPICGTDNTDNMRFCGECGADLRPVYRAMTEGGDAAPAKPTKQRRKISDLNMFKVKRLSRRATFTSLICLILSFVIFGASLAYYFACPVVTFTDEPASAPEAVELAEPEYDMEYIVKPNATVPQFNSSVSSEELAALNTAYKEMKEAVLQSCEDYAQDTGGELPPDGAYTEEDLGGLKQCLLSRARRLYEADVMEHYSVHDDHAYMLLDSGICFYYMPEIRGKDAGTAGTLRVSTISPCRESYQTNTAQLSETAEKICAEFPMYGYGGADFSDGEVNLERLFRLSESSVVLWHGHGGYLENEYVHAGPLMVTGIPITEENNARYYELLKDGSFVLGMENYLVTAAFFEKHIQDGAYDNTVFYLATCSSGKDNKLAQALLNKGAEAVYATTGNILTEYNLKMMETVVQGLCTRGEDGSYMDVLEALEYAHKTHGHYDLGDYSGAEVKLFAHENTYTLDWYEDHMKSEREVVLVLDTSDSMQGSPIENVKLAAPSFVKKVLESNATVSLVEFSAEATVHCSFTGRSDLLLDAIGQMTAHTKANIHAGIDAAYQLLSASDAKERIIVLMSDGAPNDGLMGAELSEFADNIKSEGIEIYTLGFLHTGGEGDEGAKRTTLKELAGYGNYYDAQSAEQLSFAFDEIADRICGKRSIYIRAEADVDIRVRLEGETLSILENRTSFGSLSTEYYEENGQLKTVYALRLKEGNDYDISLRTDKEGLIDYSVSFMDRNGKFTDTRQFAGVEMTPSTVISTGAVYSDTTTMMIDSEGDGENDLSIRIGKDGKTETDELASDWRITVAIISGVLLLLAAFALFLARALYKFSKINAEKQCIEKSRI